MWSFLTLATGLWNTGGRGSCAALQEEVREYRDHLYVMEGVYSLLYIRNEIVNLLRDAAPFTWWGEEGRDQLLS